MNQPNEILNQPRESKFKTSMKLTRASWRVIKLNKEILGAGAIGLLVGLVIIGLYVAALIFGDSVFFTNSEDYTPTIWFYLLTLLVMFVSYIALNFYAGAISHAAFRRFEGENPTFSESIGAARARIPGLINFSALQATIGLVLNILEERLPIAGKIAVWLTGATWGVASMFAIPLIMDKDERNPITAVKLSARTFLSIWKESAFIGLSLGLIGIAAFVILALASGALIVIAVMMSSLIIGVIAGGLFLLGLFALSIVTQSLQTVVMTAAYYYSSRGKMPAGFDEELIRSMFRPKKKWLS